MSMQENGEERLLSNENDKVVAWTNDTILLSCEDISKLEIVRVVGSGKKKIVYEVKLPYPSKKYAVAKRCVDELCMKHNVLGKEASILKNLMRQYGSQVMSFYGECHQPYDGKYNLSWPLPENITSNFNVGSTIIMEAGEPLRQNWTHMDRSCLVKQFTPADVEDLRQIARQWANYTPVRMKMGKDNRYPQNYALAENGLRHIDSDWIIPCVNCSYDTVLEHNCKVVSRFAILKTRHDCSLAYSLDNPIQFPNQHINLTDANQKCKPRY